MNYLLIDLDHTVSDAAWRYNMIAAQDWDAYHLAGKEDKPIKEVTDMLRAISTSDYGWTIMAITGRPEKFRKQTMDWLLAHNVPVDEILMRPDLSYQSTPEMKIGLLKARFGEGLEELYQSYVIFIDDNDKVIEAISGLGITTFQIAAAKRRN